MSEYAFVTRELIEKGWSGDRKYCAATADGARYLLRICEENQYDAKKLEYEMMRRLEPLGIEMCRALEFGRCDEGVYSVQTWIDGEDAEPLIPTLPEEKQYAYGLDAGRMLRKIHSIPAPASQPDWSVRFNAKIDRKIRMYAECPLKYENGQAFVDYCNANRHLLDGRPQSFQHGDYHVGNMMIDRDGKLVVIDFNRFDFGDPWEEFNRIVWCAQSAPAFARGMVDGYFDGSVPSEFWRLLALYISSNTLSSLPWAIPFGQKEIDTMLAQAAEILSWYSDMQTVIPAWYGQAGPAANCCRAE